MSLLLALVLACSESVWSQPLVGRPALWMRLLEGDARGLWLRRDELLCGLDAIQNTVGYVEAERREQQPFTSTQAAQFTGAAARDDTAQGATSVQIHPASIKPIRLQVTGSGGFAPATIRVQVHLEPKASDRIVVVEVDGPAFFRSFDLPVEGEAGPKTWTASDVRDLPAGEYVVTARVGPTRERVRVQCRTIVYVW